MILTQRMNEILRKDDAKVYSRQIKFFSRSFNQQLSTSLYALYYVLLIYDESVLCFMLRCFLHMFLSHMIDELDTRIEVVPGINRTQAFRHLSNQFNQPLTSAPNDENNNDDGIVNTEIEGFFKDWTVDQKKDLIRKMLMLFSVSWVLMITYQLVFCLGNTYEGTAYQFFGTLRKSIRDSAYNDPHSQDTDLWTVNKAVTMGGFVTNWIGDFKFRSSFCKFVGIIFIDFAIVSLQIISFINNYGVGLGVVNRFDDDEDSYIGEDNNNQNERNFNGLQGRLTIMRLNPIVAFKKLALPPSTT